MGALYRHGKCWNIQKFFFPSEIANGLVYHRSHPSFHYSQLKTPKNLFPVQTDGCNCGFFVVLSIMDLVVSQWNRVWKIGDLDNMNNQDIISGWEKLICANMHVVLPPSYNIGKTFLADLNSEPKKFYSKLSILMRMEMVILMERIHCVYQEAFSAMDCRTRWWKLGVPEKHILKPSNLSKESSTSMTNSSKALTGLGYMM
jgi:hypothetical protein